MKNNKPETDSEKLQYYLSRIENAINKIGGELQIKREFPKQEIASPGNFKSDIEERRHNENLEAIYKQNKLLKITFISTIVIQAIVILLQVLVILMDLKRNGYL